MNSCYLNNPLLHHYTSALRDIEAMNLSLFVTGKGTRQLLSLECEISHFPSLCFNWLRVAKVLRDETPTIPFM